MPINFDFLSPGVVLREFDQSQRPAAAVNDGILLIGTAPRGPGNIPIRVKDRQTFDAVFGSPSSGRSNFSDVWRASTTVTAPNYAMYAAHAWLSIGGATANPVTFIRLLGEEKSTQTSGLRAGWTISNAMQDDTDRTKVTGSGGAYGLFIAPSGASGGTVTGSLAAVFYVTQGVLRLSGSSPSGSKHQAAGIATISDTGGNPCAFTMEHITTTAATASYKFHMVEEGFSQNQFEGYIRNAFNTDPQKTNSDVSTNLEHIWVGETYEEAAIRIGQLDETSASAGQQLGYLVGLDGGAKLKWKAHNRPAEYPKSGWFIAQDPSSKGGGAGTYQPYDMESLFRFVGLSKGEWLQQNMQIGIEINKVGKADQPYSVFTVKLMDHDLNVVEQYAGCTLNPADSNYIAKKIGTQYMSWSDQEKKYSVKGKYPNLSSYIRVEMDEAVENASLKNISAMPFGVEGPITISDMIISDWNNSNFKDIGGNTHNYDAMLLRTSASLMHANPTASAPAIGGLNNALGPKKWCLQWPSLRLTTEGGKGSSRTDYHASDWLGVDHTSLGSDVINPSYVDLVRAGPYDAGGSNSLEVTQSTPALPSTGSAKYQYFFSLDDVVVDLNDQTCYYKEGSRSDQKSLSYKSGSNFMIEDADAFNGLARFKSPFFGGCDGVDITEPNPFNNRILNDSSNKTANTNYALYAFEKAIDSVRDPEVLSYDLVSAPGLYEHKLTDKIMDLAHSRADTLAIIDLKGAYAPPGEATVKEAAGNIKTTITNLRGRRINTSYACAYYPWVQLDSGDGAPFYIPSSVAAIGAIANNDSVSRPWFAPAGFNRGGISTLGQSQTLRVLNVEEHLTKKNRDDLYAVNINPIARFPASNNTIVVFGQKTLQTTRSALDRINVRRMMNFLKKTIGRIADRFLFEQNVDATWTSFRSKAERVLNNLKFQAGITDYKLQLDKTTTTQDMIDQNIMYAKVYVKPAKAIEFIVVDFIVTRSGASFPV